MANHLHKQIRDAVKTALTGLATTGANVFANRLRTLQEGELPALRISLDEESAEMLTATDDYILQRALSLAVEACAKASSALDDTLDQIGKEVEIALSGGITLGGRDLEIFYTGMRFEDEQGDFPVAIKRLAFTLTYQAAAGTPDALA